MDINDLELDLQEATTALFRITQGMFIEKITIDIMKEIYDLHRELNNFESFRIVAKKYNLHFTES